MSTKQLFKELRRDIGSVLQSGESTINVEVLLRYLTDKENSLQPYPEKDSKERIEPQEVFKQNHDKHMASKKVKHEQDIELFRSVLNAGTLAIKTSLLVNGASAVAILGFLSRVWGSGNPKGDVKELSLSLLLFGGGVLFSALSTTVAYGIQYCSQQYKKIEGVVLLYVAIVLILSSYIMYAWGAINCFQAFNSM